MSNITVTDNQIKIADALGMSAAEIAIVKNNIAKGINDMELTYFLQVCKTMELNPFNKEVWCYKDKQGNLLIFSGRDGFLAKAQKNVLFNGIRSCEVCQNDDIELNIPLGEIHHKINPKEPRGLIIGAYSIIFRKDGEPTIEWAEMSVYNKGYNTWKTHPAEMIKKVAETHALKKAFGISGIQSEYDFDVNDSVAIPIDTTNSESKLEKALS